jgi:signal transduction histidine kinase
MHEYIVKSSFLNCVGIAIENQPKMFHEFTQFDRNNLQGGGGSGLGLWICKNLAELHGGRIVRDFSTYERSITCKCML